MKKSKFLKKSLAMLLALMLVVAMIPLSAAAASPSLSYLYVDGVSIANNGGTFESTVNRYDDDEVTLRVAANALDYAGSTTGGTLEVVKKGSSTGTPVVESDNPADAYITPINLAQHGTLSGDVWTLTLRLMADGKEVTTYTLKLSLRDPHTTASLVESSATDGTGTYEVAINNGSHEINMVVPTGALTENQNGTTGAHIRVQTQDNATIGINGTNAPKDATVVDMKGGWYDISVSDNDKDKKAQFTVISESQANKSTWTINVTEVDSLRTFSYGDYEGKVDTIKNEVTVTIPKEDGKDSFGYNVDFDLPVSFTTYGDTDKVYIAEDKSDKDDATPYQVGDKLEVGDLVSDTDNTWDGGYIWVTCKGYEKLQEYKLTIKLGDANDTGIVAAYFNDNEATINGNEITANLPMRDEQNKNTDLGDVDIDLFVAADATVTGFTEDPTNQDVPGAVRWYKNGANIRDGLQVVVTAEDGSTQTYNLTATIEQNTTSAALTGIYITDGSYQAKGNISGNTITFEVPYMTLSVKEWKVYATANSAANVIGARTAGNAFVVQNGITTMNNLGFTTNITVPTGTQSVSKAISAVNMNDNDYFQNYDVVVKLLPAKTNGITLTKFQMSIQNDDPATGGPNNGADTNEKVTSRVNADNSVVAYASDGSIKDDGKTVGNTGTITIDTPYALRSAQSGLWRILTDIETVNGGVAFYGMKGNGNFWSTSGVNGMILNDLPNNKAPFTGDQITNYTSAASYSAANDGDYFVLVLPEDVARAVMIAGNITDTDIAKGTVYTIKENVQKPSTYKTMSNIYVDQANLTVKHTSNVTTDDTQVGEVSGALPWSYTVSSAEKDDLNAKNDSTAGKFLTYDIQAYATLTTNGTVLNNRFYSGGDMDSDGEVDQPDYNNRKLLFVRDDTIAGKVNMYVWDPGINDGDWVAVTDNKLITVAEDGTSTMEYTFRLTWNPANTEAELKSFSIGNSKGVFNGNNISVILPYGTDLKGLIPTFTTSEYATVTLDSKTGDPIISGKTSVNFSQTVRLVVTSEDTQKTNPYTVTVTLAEAFSDVPSSAWYYNNVMQAAANGIVSGYPDGTFKPGNSVTRRDFAIMLTQMLGVSNDGTAVSPFIDVDNDDYGVVSIAYCKAHNIISGYDDGTFKPDATITRQEAASMIVKAMGVSKASDELYPDDSTIAGWAKDAVYKAKAAGLMKGYEEDGTFRPTGKITRAEAASIMVNALNQ